MRLPVGCIERQIRNAAGKKGIPFTNCPYKRDGKDVTDYIEQNGLSEETFSAHVGLHVINGIMRGYHCTRKQFTEIVNNNYLTLDADRCWDQAEKIHEHYTPREIDFIMETFCSPVLQFSGLLNEKYFLVPNTRDFVEKVDGKPLGIFGANHVPRIAKALQTGKDLEVPQWDEFMADEDERLKLAERILKISR